MRLATRLTAAPALMLLLCAATLSSCASNGPRKPTAAQDKNAASNNTFDQNCYDAQVSGAPPPIGCPQYAQGRRTARPAPGVAVDPLPTLPSAELPTGGLLRR